MNQRENPEELVARRRRDFVRILVESTTYGGAYTREEAQALADTPPKHVTDSGIECRVLPRVLSFTDADPKTGLGPCACPYCSPVRLESRMVGAWDQIRWNPYEPHYRAWVCHGPELKGTRRLRKGM